MSRSLRVLVVEEEEAVAQAIASVLRRRGHDVRLAAGVEEALAARSGDVLVSDLELPGSCGLELLAHVQRHGWQPRTIFLATRPTLEDSRRALALGAVELLAKPFRLAELVRAVETDACPERRELARPASASRLDETYPSTHAAVDDAARAIAAFALLCRIAPGSRARIASATSELVDNARRHGYCGGRGPIRVQAEVDGADFVVRVGDDGIGFDVASLEAQALDDTLRHGLARARALAEELTLDSAPGRGTRVEAVFRATRVEFEEESGIDLSELDFLAPDVARRVLHALRAEPGRELFHLSPALAVVVGRLLAGPDPRASVEKALWS